MTADRLALALQALLDADDRHIIGSERAAKAEARKALADHKAQSLADGDALVTARSASLALNHLACNGKYHPGVLADATAMLVRAELKANPQPKGAALVLEDLHDPRKVADMLSMMAFDTDEVTRAALHAAAGHLRATQSPAPGAVDPDAGMTEWMKKHKDLDDTPCTAGAWPMDPATPACECCGKPMSFDAGEPMSRDHPGDHPVWFCQSCGHTQEPAETVHEGLPVGTKLYAATPSPAVKAEPGRRNPLLAYVDSYREMARMGDGCVSCSAVALDIEQNMAPLLDAFYVPVQGSQS